MLSIINIKNNKNLNIKVEKKKNQCQTQVGGDVDTGYIKDK